MRPFLELLTRYVGLIVTIIQRTAASNYQGYAGETALHLAAANLNLDGVRVLLGAGALVNVLDDKGQTPLDIEPAIRNVMLGTRQFSVLLMD